jgi:hypothetical protein
LKVPTFLESIENEIRFQQILEPGFSNSVYRKLFLDIRQALMDLSTRILGPNSVVQAMVSDVLEKVPSSYYDNTMVIIQVFYDLTNREPDKN